MKFSDIWFEMYIINYLPIAILMNILNFIAPSNQQLPTIAITIISIVFALMMDICEFIVIKYFKTR